MVSNKNKRRPSTIQTSDKKGKVTIPGKLSDDLAPNTAQSILRQAGF
jgi:predicted RNA binding protein YcfA (HicA-like mRNA interferase family)